MEERKVLVETKKVHKHFPVKGSSGRKLRAVDGVDMYVRSGEIVGLVGESGCGKSTLGRTVLRLYPVTSGEVIVNGIDITHFGTKELYTLRRDMQMIFQDPYSALNPRMTIYESVKAPLDVHHMGNEKEKDERVREILEFVGLGSQQIQNYPHEMSGGQRQRAVIARAVIMDPAFVVCDEPVSALDVSVRSQVLNLMKDLQLEKGMSYLFISHDLSVVRYLCDRVMVMYLGKIVEEGTKQEIFEHPAHPYTQALLSAIPVPDVDVKNKKIILQGDIPSPMAPPSGCRFHTRCPRATSACSEEVPEMRECGPAGHQAACLVL